MADEGTSRPTPLPRLKSALLEHLATSPSRDCDEDQLLTHDRPAQVLFSTSQERVTLAAAMLLFHQLGEQGGVCTDMNLVERLTQRLFGAMSREERIRVEVEVHELLDWVHHGFVPEARLAAVPPHVSPQSTHEEVARWALHHGKDLHVEYYDREKGALSREKITPTQLSAGTYLRAISHEAKEERTFSLREVGALEPVQGWSVVHHEGAMAPRDASEALNLKGQMSWLDELPHEQEEE